MKNKSHSKTDSHEIANEKQNQKEEVIMKHKSNDQILTEITSPPSAAMVYGAPVPGRTALAEVTAKLVKFLHVAGNDPEVRSALATVGYNKAVHERGWKLVRGAGSARKEPDGEPTDGVKAVTFLEGWIGPSFRRAEAVLKYDLPEQMAFVFEKLRNTRGPEAIVSIATFIARLDDLKSSPERKATRKVDHEALDALASCGITEGERKRVGAIVEIAEALPPGDATAAPPMGAQTQARLAAYSFFAKWSELARTVITNRTTLIRMGIGKRRSRGAASSPPAPTPVAPPAVVAPPAATSPSAPQLPAQGQTPSTDSFHLPQHAAE